MRKSRGCTAVLAHALLLTYELPLLLLQPVSSSGLSVGLAFTLNADDVTNLEASIFGFPRSCDLYLIRLSNPITYTFHTAKRTSYTSEKLRQALEGIAHLIDISAGSRFAPP